MNYEIKICTRKWRVVFASNNKEEIAIVLEKQWWSRLLT